MPEILIEIEEKDLQAIDRIAKEQRRSRRGQISIAIEDWLKLEKKR